MEFLLKVKYVGLLAVAIGIVTFSHDGSAENIPSKSASYVQEVSLSSKNEDVGKFVLALRAIPADSAGYSFLQTLWKQDATRFPDFNWEFMRKVRVKSEIAYFLARASHRQLIHSNDHDLRLFARQILIDNRDLAARGNAILILGLIRTNDDVPILVRVCNQEEPFTFELAVAALMSIGTRNANDALEELKRTVTSPSMVATINNLQRKDSDQSSRRLDAIKGNAETKSPTDKEVLAAVVTDLENRDEYYLARTAIPNIYKHLAIPDVRNLVRDVWHNNKQNYPSLAWERLSQSMVRVPIGQLWGQIARSYGQDAEVESVRRYVRPLLKEPDPVVRARAAECWGALGGDSDIPQLRIMALNDEPEVAMAAVVGISNIGTPAAIASLRKLIDEVKNEHVTLIIRRLILPATHGHAIKRPVVPQTLPG